VAIIRDNTTVANTLKVNADGSINTSLSFPASGLEIANDVGNPVPVSDAGGSLTVDGTVGINNFPATQAVSGTVAVSNFPATQAVSGTVAATQSGNWTTGRTWNLSSATDSLNVANFPATQSVSGTVSVSTTPTASLFAQAPPSVTVSTTSAAAAAATLTIPAAPAGQFIYVTALSIQLVNSAARAAAAATLITVTTSGIAGTPTFNYGQPVTTVGTTDVTWANMIFNSPLKGTAAATAATISAPATTGVLWVVRAHYYYAP